MNTRKILFPELLVCTALALIFQLVAGEPVQARTMSNDTCFEEIDKYIEQQLESLNLPGAAFAIVEGYEIVHLRGFGQARPNGEAPTPQTPFFIGSLTKSVTALAVMQLVEAGKIELDAPVQRYLPWFRLADPEASARMTVRHLLNQNSGFPQTVGMKQLVDFDDNPGATERQARRLATLKLSRPVGSAFEYSNVNYNLLGLIVEAASGETYTEYVQNHIFTPLDMNHSYISQAEAKENGLAVGHIVWFGFPIAVPDLPIPTGSLPSGQLISTAEDMAHYLIAQLNEGRYNDIQILSPEGIAELHRPAVDATIVGIEMGYSMGWFVEETSQGTRLNHKGTVPNFFSYMALLPEQNRGMVLLVNGNQTLIDFSLDAVGAGAASLLAGVQPEPVPWGIVPWSIRAFLIIPVLQILGVFLTLRGVRRWRREPNRRPGPVRTAIFHILIPILLNLIVVILALTLLFSFPLGFLLLYIPDLAWLFLICGGFALVWIFMRTALILFTLRKPSPPQAFVG